MTRIISFRVPRILAAAVLFLAVLPAAAQERLNSRSRNEGILRGLENEFLHRKWQDWAPLTADEIPGVKEFQSRCLREVDERRLSRSARVGYLLLLHHLDRHLDWASRTDGGAAPLPSAIGHHDHRLRFEFGVTLTARELLERGMAVFESTRAEMDRFARSLEPGLNRRTLDSRIEEDHPDADGLLETASAALERARRFTLERKFVTVPDYALRLETRWGDPRVGYPFAMYVPSPNLEKKPGVYVVFPISPSRPDPEREQLLRGNNRAWTAVVAPHEGIPGHHLQLSIAAKHSTRMRQTVYNGAFIEGWGLYVEHLLERQGYFELPAERFAQLKMRLWRAARAVIDVGLHCGGMSREEAVQLLEEGVGLEPICARLEVSKQQERPVYYSGYLVGFEEIEELRQACRRLWGDGYSDRRFHDELLWFGHIPFSVIRRVLLDGAVESEVDPAPGADDEAGAE